MPRAKISDTRDFYTTRTAADRLGVSPYLIKSRIQSGIFPPATRVTDGGVMLLDEAWLQAAQRALSQNGSLRGRRRRSPGPVVPSPESVLGYPIGTPRRLPDWPEIVNYFYRLEAASDRVSVEEMGKTTDGNPMIAVVVSAPENLEPTARQQNREYLDRLWDPRGYDDAEIEEAIANARSVAIILATQHANEIGACLMTMELAYQLAIGQDAETREILDNTLTILIPSQNPDGIVMITDWYRRYLGTEYEGNTHMPWLYHRYVGHDNNRDWFMLTQVENQHYVDLYNREHPQLVFDMHQMGRDGARFMVPPFIDPLDPNQDPVIQQGFAAVGSAIARRLTAHGKAGVATHILFDNYSPSLAYGNYHGSVDLLSEAASCRLATPVTIEKDKFRKDEFFDPTKRTWNHPLPWEGGEWTLKDIVEYDLIAARAAIEAVAKYRTQWLKDYLAVNRRAINRTEPPYAYVLRPDDEQHDPGTAAELLQTLQRGDVEIHVATAPFSADGIVYPAGTRVIRLDQPAGNFAKTLLEIQSYPDLRQWPGGPPQPPYDIAGHTLSIQMGVATDEVRTPLPKESIEALEILDEVPPPKGRILGHGRYGYAFAPTMNAGIKAIARLLGAGYRLHRATSRVPGLGLPPGSVLVPMQDGLDDLIATLTEELGLTVHTLEGALQSDTAEQVMPRLGLYQSWHASIDEGWCRWILEEYGLPYATIHDQEVRQGRLIEKYDVIVLPHQASKNLMRGNLAENDFGEPYPPEYVGGLGEPGMTQLQRFVEAGGTLVALDGTCEAVIDQFSLPVRNAIAGLPTTEFYCPGSLLRVVIDTNHPLGWGMPREATVLFMNSPAFETVSAPDPTTIVARYPSGGNPNVSGWILGDNHLRSRAALVEANLGDGYVVLVGFRPQFRAQARGTYKVFFNAILKAAQTPSHLEVG